MARRRNLVVALLVVNCWRERACGRLRLQIPAQAVALELRVRWRGEALDARRPPGNHRFRRRRGGNRRCVSHPQSAPPVAARLSWRSRLGPAGRCAAQAQAVVGGEGLDSAVRGSTARVAPRLGSTPTGPRHRAAGVVVVRRLGPGHAPRVEGRSHVQKGHRRCGPLLRRRADRLRWRGAADSKGMFRRSSHSRAAADGRMLTSPRCEHDSHWPNNPHIALLRPGLPAAHFFAGQRLDLGRAIHLGRG